MTETWTVPGFTEVRELGRGSSGRVVAAVDDVTRTPAVIKYVSPRLLHDETFRERYTREVRLLAHIEDPNLVQVIADVETAEGFAVVMEQVDGVSLREMLRGLGPLGPLAALVVLSHSLIGLAAAHQAGVLHRDYRPENVLVDSAGMCKLADLGLAVPSGGGGGGTGIVGHPSYAAPELWAGVEPGVASDLYAATAVFFECLTGRRPYRSGRSSQARAMAALAKAHREEPIPVEAVPGPMREVLRLGMAKHPAERPASAADMLAMVDDAAVSAYGPSWESQGRSRLVEIAQLIASSPPPPRAPATPSAWSAPPSASSPQAPGREAAHEPPRRPYGPADGRPRVEGDTPTVVTPIASPPIASPPVTSQPVAPPAHGRSAHATQGTHASRSEHSAPAGRPGHAGQGGVPSGSHTATGPLPDDGDDDPRTGSGLVWKVAAALAGTAVIAGVALYVLGMENEPRTTNPSSQQSTTAPEGPETRPDGTAAGLPTTAAALAARINRAAAAKPTASFAYRRTGQGTDETAARGALKIVSRGATSCDMKTWNPAPRALRARQVRVVLIGGTANVQLATWKQVPATGAAAGRTDEARDYADMAVEARSGASISNITALLNASTSLERTGPRTYKGKAAMDKLLRIPAVGPLYRTLALPPGDEQVSFVIEVTKDALPRRVQVTVTPKGRPGAVTLLGASYSSWGRPVAIQAPR